MMAGMRKWREANGVPLTLLLFSCLAVYLPSLGHDFVPLWDDAMYVQSNAAVRGFSLEHLKIAFTRNYAGNYAPLQIISYMFDYTLWGLKPAGFIFTNVVLHAINGLLFYGLLVRSRFVPITACAAACIFLFHPVQVESVVWVSQRKSVLAMTFFLFSFHEYLIYRDSEVPKMAIRHYLLSLVCFILALLAKSVVVVLPVVLMVHDLSSATRVKYPLWLRDKIPFAVIALCAAVLTFYSQDSLQLGGRREFHGGTPLATFYTMLPVLLKYIELLFWPAGLSPRYDIPIRTGLDEVVLLSGVVALVLVGIGVWLYRCRRELFSWYALFFVGLLPVSQIVPIVTLMNDRYLYFPMLGGAAFVCLGADVLIRKQYRWRALLVFISCGLLMILPLLAFKQSRTWQNTLTLWQQVVKHNPNLFDARLYLAEEYYRRGDSDGALGTSLRTLELFPHEPAALKMAGIAYNSKGDIQKAGEYLLRAVVASPRDIELLFMLADNYRATGKKQEALGVYRAVLILNPGSERALRGLADLGRE